MGNSLFERVTSLMPLEEPQPVIDQLKRYSDALDNLSAVGTHLLRWEINGTHINGDESAFVIAFFKRALELVDASSLLVENASIIPISVLIRALLEVALQFEYLLYEPSQVENKVLHLAIMEPYNMLIEAEKMLLEPRAKKLWPKYKNDIEYYTSLINNEVFDKIRDDFEKNIYTAKRDRRKALPPYWYSLSGGGKTINNLFETLDRKHYHKEVYSLLSDTVHSTRLILSTLYPDKQGNMRIRRIRDPSNAQEIVSSIARITLEIYSWMLRRRRLEEKEKYLFALEEWRKMYPDLYTGQTF